MRSPSTSWSPATWCSSPPGDLVPADLRLLRATGLTVHEAALTGESAPVRKSAETPPGPDGGGSGFDRPHLCFQGSSVVSGTASGVVVATGRDTVLSGALSAEHGLRGRGRRTATPFDRSVNGIAWTLIRFMLLTAPLVLIADALLHGRGLETMPFAVAVAVGLTPEMLPVIVTTALARGAALLARDGEVIVRRLPALHDLGAVDVLCVDKTGTLTEDRPVLAVSEDADGRPDPAVLHWAAVNALWTLHLAELPAPDALDEAVLDTAAADFGTDPGEEYEGVDALPCGPGRRLSTAVVRRPGDPRFALASTHTLVVKGAPEDVLDRCALDAAERERLAGRARALADGGLRVLAVARAERPARSRPYAPRRRARPDLHRLRRAERRARAERRRGGGAPRAPRRHGQGAHRRPPRHRRPGLPRTGPGPRRGRHRRPHRHPGRHRPGPPRHGHDGLRPLRPRAQGPHRPGAAGGRPHHRLPGRRGQRPGRAARRRRGGVCPRDGVDVAREAADVVLASKDLTALERAIVTGRRSSANIASYLRITLSSNFGNVIAMLVAGLVLPFLPMLLGPGAGAEPLLRRGPARPRLRQAGRRGRGAARPCCARGRCCAS
ncbi:hypothetical protein GCM10020000_26550 [Streptomyces olivoverticillatus]